MAFPRLSGVVCHDTKENQFLMSFVILVESENADLQMIRLFRISLVSNRKLESRKHDNLGLMTKKMSLEQDLYNCLQRDLSKGTKRHCCLSSFRKYSVCAQTSALYPHLWL